MESPSEGAINTGCDTSDPNPAGQKVHSQAEGQVHCKAGAVKSLHLVLHFLGEEVQIFKFHLNRKH